MKVFIIVSSLLALSMAAPSVFVQQAAVSHAIVAAPTAVYNQHHAQDEFGQYTYGYSGGPSAKVESKTLDGITRGSYSYVDANGILQTVSYTADDINGFRVAATNLPVSPVDTGVAPVDTNVAPIDTNTPAVFDGKVPEPVTDTPEVAQATAEHLAAVQEAIKRNEEADKADAAEAEQAPVKEEVKVEAPAPTVVHAVPIVAPYATAHYISPVVPFATYTPSSFAYSHTLAEYNPVVTYHHAAPIYAPLAVSSLPSHVEIKEIKP